MSASVMGAVMTSGPTRLRLCLALVGIADNADDFGFAQLSIATIASKARCDQRTAMRVVQSLEREGWLKVYRRVVEGKGSVYIIDIAKLGIVPDAKSRKSQWHVAFERGMKLRCEQDASSFSGDKMSPEPVAAKVAPGKSITLIALHKLRAEAKKSGDKVSPENTVSPFLPPESGDNSQGVQVTFCPDSGDISHVPILKNHRTIRTQTNPPTPLAGGERAALDEAVDRVMRELGFADRRLRDPVGNAMELYAKQRCWSLDAVAALMIERYGELAANAGLLRYQWGPKKFFAQGHWLHPESWPVDREALEDAKRRVSARVGT